MPDTEHTVADDLAYALDNLDGIFGEIREAGGGEIHTQPTNLVLKTLLAVHRVHVAAYAVVDALLVAVRDPARTDRPTLRELGKDMGLHHTTVDERIRRATGDAAGLIRDAAAEVGNTVKLSDGQTWTVQATTDNFTALVRPITDADVARWADWREENDLDRDDDKVGKLQYTVIDWHRKLRGPCNLSGWAWGDGTYTREECAAMLSHFEAGELSISHRNTWPI